MNLLARAAKATYNFFGGDPIILAAVIAAFTLATVLLQVAKAPMLLAMVIFVALIVGGLVASLAREVAGRPERA